MKVNRYGVYRSNIQAWLRQWYHNRICLLQDGIRRLGVEASVKVHRLHSSPYVVSETVTAYLACCRFVFPEKIPEQLDDCCREIFQRVQVAISRDYPPLGLFRPILLPCPV
jgi:hypothetical protein